MRKSDNIVLSRSSLVLGKFSLLLTGLALGFIIGGVAQVLNLPNWIMIAGPQIVLLVSLGLGLKATTN